MEAQVICGLSELEPGINCLNSPSFVSGLSSLSGMEIIYNSYNFWKWVALILALAGAFSGIANRIKVLVVRRRRCKSKSLVTEPLLGESEEDDYSDEDETSSSTSEEDEEEEPSPSFDRGEPTDEDFRVAGSSDYKWQNRNLRLRRRRNVGDRFSWSDFATGKSVVKLWDGLGLGLDVENSSSSLISIWDLNRDRKISSSFLAEKYEVPAAFSMSSPEILSKNLGISVWDARMSRRTPAIHAEWQPQSGMVVGIDSVGVQKVYVGDNFSGDVTVGDVRKASSPLGNLDEGDGDRWWDADTVILPEEFVDESGASVCDSVVTRCRDAVWYYLF
ncbi:uncharacterized protein LOC131152899 [Malania oleifera]|uniref:uncharacterized protein LOC131152899 n=1 Tax=Malania oleifera TaxID=397392 RepID=UPI0025ADC1EC|nr:uncharacterized protein LOC131152899 [Malania oleifera]